jgi:hypothetical protein
MITTVPRPIKRAFWTAEETVTGEERLWRERAARMTLDALGHTNLTMKPLDHNNTVRYARRWFRQIYASSEVPEEDDAEATFWCAGIVFDTVRNAVLAESPILFEPGDDEDEDEGDGEETVD